MKINLDKNKKYILACSYGPDSMCLFDLLLKGKFNFIVAHVNYHLRSEEQKEVEDLKNICSKNKIKLFIKDFYMPKNVNEESWAREVRYSWFNELSKQVKTKNVLVAHNEDDLLETFLLQKERKGIVSHYGIKKEIDYKEIKLLRPLLNYSKQQLLDYCEQNNVHYGFDLSNFNTKYKRNYLRMNVVSKLNNDERKSIIEKIKQENKLIEKFYKDNKKVFENKVIKISQLLKYNKEEIQKIIICYLDYKKIRLNFSSGFSSEIYSLIKTKKSWHKNIDEKIIISIDYGNFGIYELKENLKDYVIVNKKSSKYKSISKNSKIEFSLPLGSRVKLNNGSKNLRRCYIDWKVPYPFRKVYPVLVNDVGEIVYIPKYQKDYKENKDSLLIFDFNNLIN